MGAEDKRSFLESQKAKIAQIEIGLKAGKLATDKEDYDALTWSRVLELSQELGRLDGTSSPKTTALIAQELAFIARTNIALAFRFGNLQPQAGARPEPTPAELTQQPGHPQPQHPQPVQSTEAGSSDPWDIDVDEID